MYRYALIAGFLLFASASEAMQAGTCIAGGSNASPNGPSQGLSAAFLCAMFKVDTKKNKNPGGAGRGPYAPGPLVRPGPAPKGVR